MEVAPQEPAAAAGDALKYAIEEAHWRRCISDPAEPGDAEVLAKFENEGASS